MEKLKLQKGQTSLEVIISIGIIASVFIGIFTLFSSTISESRSVLFQHQAENLLTEGLSAVRQIENQGWSYLEDGTHGLQRTSDGWEFNSVGDVTAQRFIRTVDVTRVDDGQKDVTITITWTNIQNRENTISATTRLTTWPNLVTFGDWQSPYVSASIDIGPSARATDIVVDDEGYIYISSSITAGNKPSLYVIDGTDPDNLSYAGDMTIGSSLFAVGKSIEEAVVYTTGEEDKTYLVDTTIPALPVNINDISIDDDGLAVLANDPYLYIGTDQAFQIFDITIPLLPTEISTTNITFAVNALAQSGDFLFLATAKNNEEVMIYDISNPSSPSKMASIDLPNTTDATAISVLDETLYIGRGQSNDPEVLIYDISNPAIPVFQSSFEINGDINDMASAPGYVFLATNDSNDEFQVYYTSIRTNPVEVATLNMSQDATGIWFANNLIYISLRSNDAVQIIKSAE